MRLGRSRGWMITMLFSRDIDVMRDERWNGEFGYQVAWIMTLMNAISFYFTWCRMVEGLPAAGLV
jgi:hypothetical protein